MRFNIANLSPMTTAGHCWKYKFTTGTIELALDHPKQKQPACLVADAKSVQVPIILDCNFKPRFPPRMHKAGRIILMYLPFQRESPTDPQGNKPPP